MAGKSHEYTMNINIKSEASGIGKTNSELSKLKQDVQGLDGKSINLKVNLGGAAGKEITSFLKNISSMEKSLSTLSTRGIQALEQGFAGLAKSTTDAASGIGNVAKSADSLNGKGATDMASGMGSITKASADAASAVGQVSTAADGLSTGGAEELASSMGNVASAAQDAASSVSKVSEATSNMGSMPNWSNSYGGRYGGMRYTGQEIGLSDIVSFIGNGKNSYELTIENAMNKTRNMAVAKSWTPEAGVSGMDAYWALDTATNNSLMSLNTLAAGINATAATTGATAKDIKTHAQDFADFGTMVLGLGYDEAVAQTAVMKLGRGLHGTFAALDQYGITEESLKLTGKWNGDENDLDGYMAAVSEYSKGMSEQLMDTTTGQVATLGKSASLGGYALGEMEAQAMGGFVRSFKWWDDKMRSTTKSMGWGADVHDNTGKRVLEKTDAKGNTLESRYVDNEGNVFDDENNLVYATDKNTGVTGEQKALADGFKQKKTGIGLSTLIIGADQAISTYKTIKDTILSTYAEYKDLQRIAKYGLRGIFGNDDYEYDALQGRFRKVKNSAEESAKGPCPGEECPKQDGSKGSSNKSDKSKKKKKRRFGRIRDGISERVGNAKGKVSRKINRAKFQYNKHTGKFTQYAPGATNVDPPGLNTAKMDSFLHPNAQKGMASLEKNFADTINSQKYSYDKRMQRWNAGDNLNTIPSKSAPMIPVEHMPPREATYKTPGKRNKPHTGKRLRKPPAKVKKQNKNYATRSRGSMNRSYRRALNANLGKLPVGTAMNPLRDNPSITKNLPKSIPRQINKSLIGRRKGVGYTDTRSQRTSLNPKNDVLAQQRKSISKYGKDTNSGKRLLKEAKLRKQTEINPKNLGNTSSFFDRMDKASNNSKATRSAKRSNYANKYNGYMKNTRKAMYDVKDLKHRAGKYIDNKKKLVKSEYAKGMLRGGELQKSWGQKGRAAPYKAWSKTKKGLGDIGTRLDNSAVGNQYRSLKRQGAYVKNSVTGSRAWQTASSQVRGNAGAMMSMIGDTRAGQAVKNTRVGKAVTNAKQNGFGKTAKSGLGRIAGGARAAGGAALSGVSKGISGIASGAGKAVGAISGIGAAFSSILGPIGAIIMGVTLFTGLLDAMGVDWMGPLQTAFGGAFEALQPLMQGFGQWMADTATAIAPYITSFAEGIAPILGSLGEFLSGGLSSLGQILLPIFEGIGQLFSGDGAGGFLQSIIDGLTSLAPLLSPITALFSLLTGGEGGGGLFDGLGGIFSSIQPLLDTLGALLTGGGEALGGMFGGIISGIGGALAGVFSTIWGTITSGINGVISTISSSITNVITTIGTTLQGIIDSIVSGIQTVIDSLASGLQTISDTLTTIGTTVSDLVLKFGELGVAVTGFFMAVLNGKFDEIKTKIDEINTSATTLSQQFTGMATSVTTMQTGWASIQNSVMMMSTSLVQAIASLSQMGTILSSIVPVIASAMAQAVAVIQQFGSMAIQIMGNTATGMSSAFAGNFHITAAVNAEMAGAYAALSAWGARMVAKAAEIGAAVSNAMLSIGMGKGSPGYIWRGVDEEFYGAFQSMLYHGAHMINSAGRTGKDIVKSWDRTQEHVNYDVLGEIASGLSSSVSLPQSSVSVDSASFNKSIVDDIPKSVPLPPTLPVVDLPIVREPKVSKDIRVNNQQQGNVPPVYNFNHYGDIDNEERANKVVKYFSKKLSFENKRANRTV